MRTVPGLSAVQKKRRTEAEDSRTRKNLKRSRSELVDDLRRLAAVYRSYPIIASDLEWHANRLEDRAQ